MDNTTTEWAPSIPEQAKQAQALEAQTLHPACYILLSALVRSSALGAR